ncbi:MAG TPA: hypothetical protein VGI31_06305 [Streptosporangiaceae bacterium]
MAKLPGEAAIRGTSDPRSTNHGRPRPATVLADTVLASTVLARTGLANTVLAGSILADPILAATPTTAPTLPTVPIVPWALAWPASARARAAAP